MNGNEPSSYELPLFMKRGLAAFREPGTSTVEVAELSSVLLAILNFFRRPFSGLFCALVLEPVHRKGRSNAKHVPSSAVFSDPESEFRHSSVCAIAFTGFDADASFGRGRRERAHVDCGVRPRTRRRRSRRRAEVLESRITQPCCAAAHLQEPFRTSASRAAWSRGDTARSYQ